MPLYIDSDRLQELGAARMKTPKRQPPVRIPIPFEQFVEGVLQIDAKKLPAAKAKKAAKKRAKGKSNRNNQADG